MSTTEAPVVLFDTITIVALSSLVALVVAGIFFANVTLPANLSSAKRFLFIWHASDALCHLIIEGSFVYHCLFSYITVKDGQDVSSLYPTPDNFLYSTDRIYGPQAGGANIFAQMWMVYARADKRWAGVDIGVFSLEVLTVLIDTPMALLVCYYLAKGDYRANLWMIILATAEIYGGWMTFAPEWFTGNVNLDASNFLYYYVYLWLFNGAWVVIPIYAIWHASCEISSAFKVKEAKSKAR